MASETKRREEIENTYYQRLRRAEKIPFGALVAGVVLSGAGSFVLDPEIEEKIYTLFDEINKSKQCIATIQQERKEFSRKKSGVTFSYVPAAAEDDLQNLYANRWNAQDEDRMQTLDRVIAAYEKNIRMITENPAVREFKEEQKTAANAFLYGMLATGALAIGSAAYLFLRAGMQRKRELKALEERNGK